MEYRKIDSPKIDQILANNPNIAFSSKKSDKYDEFWEKHSKMGFLRTVNRLTHKTVVYYLSKLKYDIKYSAYSLVKPIVKKRKRSNEQA